MSNRGKNLEKRLLEQNDLEVRILFLDSELEDELNKSGNNPRNFHTAIKRYEHLVDLLRKSAKNKVKVRLIPNLSKKELIDTCKGSYALIFNQTESRYTDATMAYASQANVPYFKIHIIQINTDTLMEKLYHFETFRWSALDEDQTLFKIENYIKEDRNR
jgi:hypothetical protein